MTQTTRDKIIDEVVALIEAGWTKKAYARDRHGTPCSSHSDKAASFCLIGALHRAALNLDLEGHIMNPDFNRLYHDLADTTRLEHGNTLLGFNDYSFGPERVLKLLEEAR